MQGQIYGTTKRLLIPNQKVCPGKLEEIPPIANILNSRSLGSSSGLAVQIHANWLLTCQHIVSNGSRDKYDLLNDAQVNYGDILGGCIQGTGVLVKPSEFHRHFRPTGCVDSLQELLVLLKVPSGADTGKYPGLDETNAVPQTGYELWATAGARHSTNGCAVARSKFSTLSPYPKSTCYYSEEFQLNSGLVVRGDSGGGFFSRNGDKLVLHAIQNAMGKTSTGVRALAIPVANARGWINDVINKL